MRKLFIVCFLVATCWSQQITFKSNRSLLLVNVSVNGQQKTMIFDTGAERTMLNERNISVERQKQSVEVAGKLFNMPVIYTDLSSLGLEKVHADGVLGQDVLRKFHNVVIDYSTNTVEMR